VLYGVKNTLDSRSCVTERALLALGANAVAEAARAKTEAIDFMLMSKIVIKLL